MEFDDDVSSEVEVAFQDFHFHKRLIVSVKHPFPQLHIVKTITTDNIPILYKVPPSSINVSLCSKQSGSAYSTQINLVLLVFQQQSLSLPSEWNISILK